MICVMDGVPQGQAFSHYPSLPPPARVRLVVTGPHPCGYFPGRSARTRAFWAAGLDPDVYHRFMDAGFRRSGRTVYQPVCDGCRACVPIRVPVATFAPSKSQRRALRRNADLAISPGAPEPTPEKHELYEKYRRHWHSHDDPRDWHAFVDFLYDSPVETVEVCYREPGGGLLGVGVCDLCDSSLSSVYFYFDPDHAKRALGTFSALWEIGLARRLGIPHYYLGYWVSGCAAMEYKADFRPCELLGTDGVWRPV